MSSADSALSEHVYHRDSSIGLSENKMPQTTPTVITDSSPSLEESIFDDPLYSSGYIPPPVSIHKTTPNDTPTLMMNPGYVSPPPRRGDSSKTTPLSSSIRSSFKKLGSLRRSKSNLKKVKSESTGDLLAVEDDAGDYDHLEKVATTPTVGHAPQEGLEEEEEEFRDDGVIYSNMEHYRLGAMGNAGQRWESRQKTSTLFLDNN